MTEHKSRERGSDYPCATLLKALPDLRRGPILCPPRGAIDPFPVRDERGQLFLVWKESGDNVRIPTAIRAQPLSSDGLRLTGPPTTLITADQPWERGIVGVPP